MKIVTREKGGGYTFDRVRIPLLLRGSINRTVYAGHMRSLGIEIGWNSTAEGWAHNYFLSLWGIVAFRYEDTKGGTLKACKPGLTISWFKISKPIVRAASKY